MRKTPSSSLFSAPEQGAAEGAPPSAAQEARAPKAAPKFRRASKKTGLKSFWGAVLAMVVVTLGLYAAALRTGEGSFLSASLNPGRAEIPATVLEQLLSKAAKEAQASAANEIDALLRQVYAPAYAAVPAYASFHYSMIGGHTELLEATQGIVSRSLQERVFGGFEARMAQATESLNQKYVAAYRRSLEAGLDVEARSPVWGETLTRMRQVVIEDSLSRIQGSAPLAVGATIATNAMAKTLLPKLASGFLGRKIGSSALGGLVGGGLCVFGGPWGIGACIVIGCVLTWILVDYVLIKLDEGLNREKFEAQLRKILDADLAEKKAVFEEALKRRAAEADSVVKDFRLRDL